MLILPIWLSRKISSCALQLQLKKIPYLHEKGRLSILCGNSDIISSQNNINFNFYELNLPLRFAACL